MGLGENLASDCSVLPLFHSDGLSALPMTYLWSSARCVICERGEKCSGGVMARNSGHYKRVERSSRPLLDLQQDKRANRKTLFVSDREKEVLRGGSEMGLELGRREGSRKLRKVREKER